MSEQAPWIIAVTSALALPIDSAVHRFFNLVDAWCKPKFIIRENEAYSEVHISNKHKEIALKDIDRRAKFRWQEENIRWQQHMETVTLKAGASISEDAKPELVDRDWLEVFYSKARLVGDDDMQGVWARILAGEANDPGSFSRRTLSILGDFDRTTAEAFTKLSSYVVQINGHSTIVLPWERLDNIYETIILPMEALGLISSPISGTAMTRLPSEVIIKYGHHVLKVLLPGPDEVSEVTQYRLATGAIEFTPYGKELSRICTPELDPDLWPTLKNMWKDYKVTDLTDPKN